MVDFLVGFSSPVLPKGNRLALLVEAGGAAAAGADAASHHGFEIPFLSEPLQDEMQAILEADMPPFARPRNPVDTVWTPDEDPVGFTRRCSEVMLREMDALILVSYSRYDDEMLAMLAALRDETQKPILVVPGHPTESRPGMAQLVRSGIPSFTSPERAVAALAAMLATARYRQGS
jgi:acetyltransferase